MIDFKVPKLIDKEWADEIFLNSGSQSCENTFVNLLSWANAYDEKIALVNDFLIIFVGSMGGCYNYGLGHGDRKALIKTLYADSLERGNKFKMFGLTKSQCDELALMFPDSFDFVSVRDSADYCYTVDKLADLNGKKLHAKRNHINRFIENYPDWHVEKISDSNIPQCIQLALDWEKAEAEAGLDDYTEREGEKALKFCANNFKYLELEGLILYGDNSVENPLAFTMGRTISGNTFDVFFEKAYADVQGAYPMINREFARYIRDNHKNIAYINREDDVGLENLRKAKLSYYPDMMIEKYLATLKDGVTL